MATITDPWDNHDWNSAEYAKQWAERQDGSKPHRDEAFGVLAATLPFAKSDRIKILDVGSGYGALTLFLLNAFPNAEAVCHDGSAEMLALGRTHLADLNGRVKFMQSDLSNEGWGEKLGGPFNAVVSSIAIHNVRAYETIRSIYAESFNLIRPGGCFLNLDRMRPSVAEQLRWLDDAGFESVQSYWDGGKRSIVGGIVR